MDPALLLPTASSCSFILFAPLKLAPLSYPAFTEKAPLGHDLPLSQVRSYTYVSESTSYMILQSKMIIFFLNSVQVWAREEGKLMCQDFLLYCIYRLFPLNCYPEVPNAESVKTMMTLQEFRLRPLSCHCAKELFVDGRYLSIYLHYVIKPRRGANPNPIIWFEVCLSWYK